MNKYLGLLFVLFFSSFASNASSLKDAGAKAQNLKTPDFSSATAWKSMYFIALTKKKPSEIDLSQELMSSLLSTINVRSAIYTGAALEPKYLINSKGVTVWIAMWVFIRHANSELLKSLGAGPGFAWVLPARMNNAFGNHINWPEKMLRSHNFDIKGYQLVAIPFLVPVNAPAFKPLSQSLKAPDGSLEVLAFHEFDEKNPESLLIKYEAVANAIPDERRDLPSARH